MEAILASVDIGGIHAGESSTGEFWSQSTWKRLADDAKGGPADSRRIVEFTVRTSNAPCGSAHSLPSSMSEALNRSSATNWDDLSAIARSLCVLADGARFALVFLSLTLVTHVFRIRMAKASNQLLDLLPRRDRLRLMAVCDPVNLGLGEVICESSQLIRYVYFPTGAFVSLITPIDAKPVLEVGLAGNEGMVGIPLLLGVKQSPFQALVQGEGASWRLSSLDFSREIGRSAPLRDCLKRYLYVLMVQLASTAACTHFHLIGQRLARWLLMTHDRAGSDHFHVTHEFLAYMLGVRRVGVTNAAHELQRLGLITYHRGEVTVCDRAALESSACGCYADNRLTYASVMRGRRKGGPKSNW